MINGNKTKLVVKITVKELTYCRVVLTREHDKGSAEKKKCQQKEPAGSVRPRSGYMDIRTGRTSGVAPDSAEITVRTWQIHRTHLLQLNESWPSRCST